MENDIPRAVEMPRLSPFPDTSGTGPAQQRVRARLFALVAGLTLVAGLILTLLQPAVYRATATVLMTAPVAIDAPQQEANIQDVAIQSRILLGGEVTAALLRELRARGYEELDASGLRQLLSVQPVSDTNLVEMAATGPDPGVLPHVVNAWIDVYLDIRAGGIEANQQQTVQMVEDQLADLELKLTALRAQLADYREEHNIASAERQENAVMARLDGLNEALNSALEKEVTARAHLQTLELAIARGDKVVPVSERDGVAEMEKELSQLRMRMAGLTQSYTMEYIRKQPRFRDMPDRIAQLESDLAAIYDEGQAIELSAAQQRHQAAMQTVQELQAQYDEHREEAASFTTIYATHEALAEDLARMEAMNRDTQARLLEVQVSQVNNYPQVSVIDRAGDESTRLGPDYRLWLGGSLAAALAAGVLAVWLYGFLGPRQQPAYVTLSGVHMYPTEGPGRLTAPAVQGIEQRDPALLADNPADDDEQGRRT